MQNNWPPQHSVIPIGPGALIADRYRLQVPLGTGSFGQVFLAEDLKFKPPRLVAIKFLHPQFLVDPQVREELEREASTLAHLKHPNILRVIDFEIKPNIAYVITDYAENGSLVNLMRPGTDKKPVQIPLPRVAFFLRQLADALDYAHSQGLIHRDIKPLNVLIDSREQPLLADFGLATPLANTQSSVMVSVNTSGTPFYMAPEQWQGQAGKASDIYALAIMTYQMIAGQPPFMGNDTALGYQHINSPVPLLSQRAPGLVYPPGLDAVFAEALAKDPHKRTRPASEFARRFDAALGVQPLPAPEPAKPEAPYTRTEAVINLPPPPQPQKAAEPAQFQFPPVVPQVTEVAPRVSQQTPPQVVANQAPPARPQVAPFAPVSQPQPPVAPYTPMNSFPPVTAPVVNNGMSKKTRAILGVTFLTLVCMAIVLIGIYLVKTGMFPSGQPTSLSIAATVPAQTVPATLPATAVINNTVAPATTLSSTPSATTRASTPTTNSRLITPTPTLTRSTTAAAGSISGVVTYSNLSVTHVTGKVNYPQDPPVGGQHNPVWQNCGIYDQPVVNETAVHSMEHGAVWITYQPNLPASSVDLLRQLVRGKGYIILAPYTGLTSTVVASAWGVQLKLDDVSDPRLAQFIDYYRSGPQTPEPGAPCTGGVGEPSGQ